VIIRKPEVWVPAGQLHPDLIRKVERYARVCYKSEERMGEEFNPRFLRGILQRGHESVIEHEKITVLFVVDRGVSHEIVRHRIASYSQESTRYVNYSQGRFGQEIAVIEPFYFQEDTAPYRIWQQACGQMEQAYMALLEAGCSPQEARAVLPNSLKTELVATYNLREWRHFFRLRCAVAAHPQMRQVAIPLLLHFQEQVPVVFEDIPYDQEFPSQFYARLKVTDDLLLAGVE